MQSAPSPGHPLMGYLETPKDPNSLIQGKPFSIAQLLEGVRGVPARRQLLQAYWELAGKLAEYNCRFQAEQQAGGPSAPRDAKINQTVHLLRQQRRASEVEFVKKQWQLAELLRRTKGTAVTEENLPIPTDYPLFKKYETHSDKIARTDRSRYVGRMIPIQEQLVQSRHHACRGTFEMLNSIPPDSQQLLLMLNQRTEAFLGMTEAIVEYNKMIAEYASETIGPEISRYRFVGALIELPKFDSTTPQRQPDRQMASPDSLRFSGTPGEMRKLPDTPHVPRATFADHELPIAENRQNEFVADAVMAPSPPPGGFGRRVRPENEQSVVPSHNFETASRPGHEITPASFQAEFSTENPNERQNEGTISQVSHVESQPQPPRPMTTMPAPKELPEPPPAPPMKTDGQ